VKLSTNGRILAGLVLGGLAGVAANLLWRGAPRLEWLVGNLTDPIGQLFLRLLLMVVVPLVFATLVVGITTLGGMRDLGRIGLKTLGLYLGLALVGALLGLILAGMARPGQVVTAELRSTLLASVEAGAQLAPAAGLGPRTLVDVVPANPVAAAANDQLLALLFFTLVFGTALAAVPPARAAPVLRVLEGVGEASGVIVGFAMKVAPIGVAALAFSGFARFGLEFLRPLAAYVAVVIGGLALLLFGGYALVVRLLAKASPAWFFGRSHPALVTALATASSNATLPTTLRVAREGLGLPAGVAGFVIPLGASLSRSGTALFEAATAIFLAQALGVEVSLLTQGLVVVMATLTAVAAGGVPSGAIPLLATVVGSAGVPTGAIALILGVEPILSMARTVPNVGGALLTTLLLGGRPTGRAGGEGGGSAK
jgi:DAACS family dicarboxylate/amino acid:cation (Na+ or H+) symporter